MNSMTVGGSEVIEVDGFKVNEEEIRLVQTKIKEEPTKIAKTMHYMQLRNVDKMGRLKAFKKAFPERCKYGADSHKGNFGINENRDYISDDAVIIKAKRLESSRIYDTIVNMLSTSLFAKYFMARTKILDAAAEKSLDDNVADRDRVQYMKVFLEETRKADEAKGLEVNVNIGAEYKQVTNNIEVISKRLEGLPADKIIDLINTKDK